VEELQYEFEDTFVVLQ